MKLKNDMILDKLLPHDSSFRDPCGHICNFDGQLYRQINKKGSDDYQHAVSSGFYDILHSKGYLISHKDVSKDFTLGPDVHALLQPDYIPFISYPYEWSFSQFKDAALLTLEIARLSLEYGMILKDASAFNVQFHKGKPIFIDTSSFTIYQENMPWVAYNQFCKHFLAPLLLMALVDVRLNKLTQQYIDGIPLDLTSSLLPFKSKLSFSIFLHIHAHAKIQKKYSDSKTNKKRLNKVSKVSLLGLIDNLTSVIKKLNWHPIQTEWGDYYNQTNYSNKAATYKGEIIREFFLNSNASSVWDLGGNNGYYSRILAEAGGNVVCFDVDPMAVEMNYRKVKQDDEQFILPIVQDLTNPSGSLGWHQKERSGLLERAQHVDLIMALALIHHLAISNNIPLTRIAEYFADLAAYLIIEFVPKEDTQVQRLLMSRTDIFSDYHIESFKKIFSYYYEILEEKIIYETSRTIFLMRKKGF